jgi:predicted transport protein
MKALWACPKCDRRFTRKNQRHACGTGEREQVLRSRPAEVVELYAALEAFVNSLGPVEFVTRERYVLLRSKRVFADLGVMTDTLRLAIHLPRHAVNERFIKIVADNRQVTHVAKLRGLEELEAMKPFLREAYEYSIA